MISFFNLAMLIYAYYVFNRDPTLLNPYDYFDYAIQFVVRVSVVGAKYGYFSK